MKNILIAATIVGTAAAGVILYLRSRDKEQFRASRVIDAASDAYNAMNKSMNAADRPAQHSMG